jgi:hypothetical protein
MFGDHLTIDVALSQARFSQAPEKDAKGMAASSPGLNMYIHVK